jgi:hypothetical protein
VDKIF